MTRSPSFNPAITSTRSGPPTRLDLAPLHAVLRHRRSTRSTFRRGVHCLNWHGQRVRVIFCFQHHFRIHSWLEMVVRIRYVNLHLHGSRGGIERIGKAGHFAGEMFAGCLYAYVRGIAGSDFGVSDSGTGMRKRSTSICARVTTADRCWSRFPPAPGLRYPKNAMSLRRRREP